MGPPPCGRAGTRMRLLRRFWLYGVLLAALLPFLGKAYHIDDPAFLYVADHIRVSPTSPYDFPLNWTTYERPAFQTMVSPPLHGYYLALVRTIGPDAEWWCHLWMLPFSLLGLYAVRRLAGGDDLAPALWLSAPAVLVSATNLMPDVTVAALSAMGVAFFLEENLIAASILVTLACLERYNGAAILPALAFYALSTRRPRALIALLPAVVGMLAWLLHTRETLTRSPSSRAWSSWSKESCWRR